MQPDLDGQSGKYGLGSCLGHKALTLCEVASRSSNMVDVVRFACLGCERPAACAHQPTCYGRCILGSQLRL